MNKSVKFGLFTLFAFNVAQAETESFCIVDSCFEKQIGTEREANVTEKYYLFVESIDDDPIRVVHNKIKSENPGRSIRKYFGWIEPSSLVYVIVGENYSAALLEKTETDRYALYYNHEVGKFEFSHETPKGFEVIERAWINGTEPPEITR